MIFLGCGLALCVENMTLVDEKILHEQKSVQNMERLYLSVRILNAVCFFS